MISVYHNDDFISFSFLNEKESRDRFSKPPSKLKKVAEVATDNLDEAFRLTNHIDSNWSQNKGVICIIPSRSTSVGDVLDKDGIKYLVASVGFINLGRI